MPLPHCTGLDQSKHKAVAVDVAACMCGKTVWLGWALLATPTDPRVSHLQQCCHYQHARTAARTRQYHFSGVSVLATDPFTCSGDVTAGVHGSGKKKWHYCEI